MQEREAAVTREAEEYRELELPNGSRSRLRLRLEEETSGSTKWRVQSPRRDEPDFLVCLLGATVSKMEELHHRKLTQEDVDVGIYRAVERARGHLENRPVPRTDRPVAVDVMIRDSDLAELRGERVGPTNDVPPAFSS